jgi:hypothetical protein
MKFYRIFVEIPFSFSIQVIDRLSTKIGIFVAFPIPETRNKFGELRFRLESDVLVSEKVKSVTENRDCPKFLDYFQIGLEQN